MKYTPKYLLPAVIALSCALATPVYAADTDNDGVDDAIDNCLGKSNTDQRDTDGDGFGNRCDGDLNNDGKTNSLDLGLFKKKLGSTNPDADFNGDGIVNAADTSLLQQLSQKVPGPTAIKANPALIANPPKVSSVKIIPLTAPLPNGNNGTVYATVASGSAITGNTIVVWPKGGPIPLNDLGISPDQNAGDSVFTGNGKIDFADLDAREAALASRISALSNPTVSFFNGRELIATKPFSTASSANTSGNTVVSNGSITGFPFLEQVQLPMTFDASKVLLINHKNVVGDPSRTFDPCNTANTGNNTTSSVDNVWSFKTLMANMSPNPNNPAVVQQFVHQWLQHWMQNSSVNSFTIPARTNIQNFFPGWDGVNATTLNMNLLPFRLLAIVNRIDLEGGGGYGSATTAFQPGETRFVFGLVKVNANGSCPASPAREMTAILEYGDPDFGHCSFFDFNWRAWQWLSLENEVLGSPNYNSALQSITDTVTQPGVSVPKINGSALNQLRTNDHAFNSVGDTEVELREFVLGTNGNLQPDTIKQTPDRPTFDNTQILANFIEQNASDILNESHLVPLAFNGMPFRAASVRYNGTSFWDAPIDPNNLPQTLLECEFDTPFAPCYQTNITDTLGLGLPDIIQSESRHKFSLHACDDCHARETNTTFFHIHPLSPLGTSPAIMNAMASGFLKGVVVIDPSPSNGFQLVRGFQDLVRRGQILEEKAFRSCTPFMMLGAGINPPLNFPH